MDIFSDTINSGDVLRAETYQNILNFVKGSHVGGGSVSSSGLMIPSDQTRNPRIVRFIAEEPIQNYSIIELTEQVLDEELVDNQVPTFRAKPANGTSGTLFYTESSSAEAGESGMAYTIGGEPILIRSDGAADGVPSEGIIAEQAGGAFRYLGESHTSDAKWFLPMLGGSGENVPVNPKVRLVQPKELFPACEYKSLQDVYGCSLEYSDDSTEWIKACEFDITGGRITHTLQMPDEADKPHQFWRFNLKGFCKPEDPDNEHADRGFYTFGRLWDVWVWIKRQVETKKTISWQTDKEILQETEYTFTATTPDHWKINTFEPLSVNLTLFPSIENGELHYRAGSGEWKNLGSFTSEKRVTIPAEDLQILINPDVLSAEQGSGQSPKTFTFRVDRIDSEYHPAIQDSQRTQKEVGTLSLRKPTYTLSPDDAERVMPVPVKIKTADGRPQTAAEGDFTQEFGVTVQENPNNFSLEWTCKTQNTFWDSKPVPRKAENHRYWTLVFDEPEVLAKIWVDTDQHAEHYIVCPGGRDFFKQDISFIYSFDLESEQWTATTFPQLQKPMYNMDAKIVELADKTHQLVVLSGQISSGFSNFIQGYNFEKDYVQNAVDLKEGSVNFAGRPALVGNPMVRGWDYIKYPDGENDFSKSLMVVGGGEKSYAIRPPSSGTAYYDSSLFFVQGSSLQTGAAYETSNSGITTSITVPGPVAGIGMVDLSSTFKRAATNSSYKLPLTNVLAL